MEPSGAKRWYWLLAALTVCVHGSFALHPAGYGMLGLEHAGVWFLDSLALLASSEALAQGLDPYAYNPLDVYGRPHVYSHWWLWLGDLGLTRASNFWLGLSWVLLFLGSALQWLRPKNAREFAFFALILVSPPMLLIVNRANNDLVVFILMLMAVLSLDARKRVWRWLAVLAIALAAGLKYYPATAALVLLAGQERREVWARVGLTSVALLLVGWSIRHDLLRLGSMLPEPEGLYTYGAAVGLGLLGVERAWVPWLVVPVVLGAAGIGFLLPRGKPAATARPADYYGFVVGAVLLSACFWTQTNYAYRWVFVILLAPWLWRVAGDRIVPAVSRRLAAWTVGLLLLALWYEAAAYMVSAYGLVQLCSAGEAQAWLDRLYAVLQPAHWILHGCLLVFLGQFIGERGTTLWPRLMRNRSVNA